MARGALLVCALLLITSSSTYARSISGVSRLGGGHRSNENELGEKWQPRSPQLMAHFHDQRKPQPSGCTSRTSEHHQQKPLAQSFARLSRVAGGIMPGAEGSLPLPVQSARNDTLTGLSIILYRFSTSLIACATTTCLTGANSKTLRPTFAQAVWSFTNSFGIFLFRDMRPSYCQNSEFASGSSN
eukprot:6191338-Pleurochrysis_carterae.AAC.1